MSGDEPTPEKPENKQDVLAALATPFIFWGCGGMIMGAVGFVLGATLSAGIFIIVGN